jgi:hypothetical protein
MKEGVRMKNILNIFLCLIICLSFSSCSKEDEMTIREQYEEYVVNYFEEAYSPHYQIEDFEFSNTELFENEVSVEATFYLKMIYKNFDKSPNTVDYIRNEKNPEIKKRLIEEYSQIQESNFGLKLLAEIDNGKLDLDTVEILASDGVVNNKYYPIDEYLPVREIINK